jgi:hypothetical protein
MLEAPAGTFASRLNVIVLAKHSAMVILKGIADRIGAS